jgi:hypothetical protein
MAIAIKPRWIKELSEFDPYSTEEYSKYGPDAFYCSGPYASPSGADLDRYVATPGFREYTEHEDGGLVATPEMRYLMVGMIGTHNVCGVSGGVVVPTRDGIDLPMPSGRYLVRIVNDWGQDEFTVSRIHIVNGKEQVEGQADAWCGNVGDLAYRAGMFSTWGATEWVDIS